MTLETMLASGYWPPPWRDTAWHGPEGYLINDWEETLGELGVRAATFQTEENDGGYYPLEDDAWFWKEMA